MNLTPGPSIIYSLPRDPSPENLAVYFNGTDWIVAESENEALRLCAEYYELSPDECGEMILQPSDELLTIHQGDPYNAAERREQTMAAWIAEKGRGFLASTEF